MIINTKVRYAVRAMIEIASHDNNEGVFQKDIAKNQNLSEKYLDPIILSLKVVGLIKNVGGKKSGYTLTKSQSDITVLDIYKAFEPAAIVMNCIKLPYICDRSAKCSSKEFWSELNDAISVLMQNKTLESLVNRCKELNTG